MHFYFTICFCGSRIREHGCCSGVDGDPAVCSACGSFPDEYDYLDRQESLNILLIALVIIFQPEMRKALENLGRKNILASLLPFDFSKGETAKFSDRTITGDGEGVL